jgi:uncharacterized cupredoxin-like copper-binding protein
VQPAPVGAGHSADVSAAPLSELSSGTGGGRWPRTVIALSVAALLVLGAVYTGLLLAGEQPTGGLRQIVIEDMRYVPNRLDVKVGETITLQVVNRGSMQHDVNFASLHMPNRAGAQVILEPGETSTMQLKFDAPGTHTFGCSHPGHADVGMTGAVFVGR